ncbi:hypothetical protein DFS34DRAFT_594705 [Phlyctochytrium arcticum]|nr:hypothetical protein DFS34DRAFT_594705 [Phlyctochytrium arcticum]
MGNQNSGMGHKHDHSEVNLPPVSSNDAEPDPGNPSSSQNRQADPIKFLDFASNPKGKQKKASTSPIKWTEVKGGAASLFSSSKSGFPRSSPAPPPFSFNFSTAPAPKTSAKSSFVPSSLRRSTPTSDGYSTNGKSQPSSRPSSPSFRQPTYPNILCQPVISSNKTAREPDSPSQPNLFALLKEQHACQREVDPVFPCRFMHTANTMEGSHQISRYSHPEAFVGMEPGLAMTITWTEVPRLDTFTLGNGIVLTGSCRYRRIKGDYGVAVRVEGIIIVGIQVVAAPTQLWDTEMWDATCPVPDLAPAVEQTTPGSPFVASTTDIDEAFMTRKQPHASSPRRQCINFVPVNVLPTMSPKSSVLHRFEDGTRIGNKLKLLKGSYLDDQMVLHGPFVYRGACFDASTIIHADGVFGQFRPAKNGGNGQAPPSTSSAPSPDAPPRSDRHRGAVFAKQLESIRAAQALQENQKALKDRKRSGDPTSQSSRGNRLQTTKRGEGEIYVDLCIDQDLNPWVYCQEQQSGASSNKGNSGKSSQRAGIVPTGDCYGYHHKILHTRLRLAMRRPVSMCWAETASCDARTTERRCSYCGIIKPKELGSCTRCRQVKYCNRICQSKHWKTEHRIWCAMAAKANWGAVKKPVPAEFKEFDEAVAALPDRYYATELAKITPELEFYSPEYMSDRDKSPQKADNGRKKSAPPLLPAKEVPKSKADDTKKTSTIPSSSSKVPPSPSNQTPSQPAYIKFNHLSDMPSLPVSASPDVPFFLKEEFLQAPRFLTFNQVRKEFTERFPEIVSAVDIPKGMDVPDIRKALIVVGGIKYLEYVKGETTARVQYYRPSDARAAVEKKRFPIKSGPHAGSVITICDRGYELIAAKHTPS